MKRVQIPMDLEEYARLEEVARRKGVPVAELFRTAVRERYLRTEEKHQLANGILGLDLPVESWEETEAAIIEARSADLELPTDGEGGLQPGVVIDEGHRLRDLLEE